MLIQVAINNIDNVEQGEEILKKWHYHLDEDQSHVVLERAAGEAVVRISGFHPWSDELEEGDEGCCCDDDSCECGGEGHCGKEDDENGTCSCHSHEDDSEAEGDEEGDEEGEEAETIYLGQALFVPEEEQARALAAELLEDDYIGTIQVLLGGTELTDTDTFRALPAATKDAVIAAIEDLGDAEAYLSLYEVMGFKD